MYGIFAVYIFQMLQNPEEFNTAVQALFSAQQQAILAGESLISVKPCSWIRALTLYIHNYWCL